MKYINYFDLKTSYTIPELCELFEMTKKTLKEKSEQYGIPPVRNEIGEAIFTQYDVRRLHNKIYHEDRQNEETWDPWAD